MKRLQILLLLFCLSSSRVWSIMMVDVAGEMFPPGTTVDQVSSSFATTYAPTVYRPQTGVIGPENNFGNWAFIFDYDQGPLVMPMFASRRIVGDFTLTFTCRNGSSTQHWDPQREMTYSFDAAFPFFTYEYPPDFFTMVPFGTCTYSVNSEEFNNSGTLPPTWTLQSSSPALTTPWAPVQENGSDWAVETSHPALGTAMDEWLISPVYDLSWWEGVRVGFSQAYTHANSEAAFRSSSNGGLSWTTRGSFTQSVAGDTLFDVSSWADGNANARFAFRFHADAATGGSAWRVDDFWLDGVPKPPLASAPVPDQGLPVWDQTSGTVGCTFTQPLGVRGDSLQVRVDMNGDGDYLDGVAEAWQLLPAQGDAEALVLQHTFGVEQNGWYLFEFRAKSGAGRWGYSGSQGAEGAEDDWGVEVLVEAPLAGTPLPAQPPVAWSGVTGTIGCTFSHPAGVDGGSLAWRLDLNRDGDYLDGGVEDWQALPPVAHATTLVATALVTVPVNGSHAFEWRARGVAGLWAWSGTASAEGLVDDWQVLVNADVEAPQFSSLLPNGQPTPAWQGTLTQVAGATVSDSLSGVNGAALAWRLDASQDGDYLDGGLEDWQTLPSQGNASSLSLSVPVTLPADGDFSLQLRAVDVAGNEAISPPLHLRGDMTPPTVSTLLFNGVSTTSVALLFTPATDLAFSHYEVRVSTDALVDPSDPLWGAQQDPALAQAGTSGTTVAGLAPGTAYWFRLFAMDQAGNRNAGSNVLTHVTGGTPVAAVTDLRATRTSEGVLLSWTAPTQDVEGYSPVAIERFDIHASDTAWFVPTPDTRIGSSTSPSFLVGATRTQTVQAYFKVVVVGAGIGAPLGGMVRLEPGTFTMGPDALGNGAAHPVTLTHPFWMDTYEVTNADYLTALQWAFDNGHVTATATTVMAHGVELVDLDDIDCEMAFNPATNQFSLVARSHSTSWGGPGPAYPEGYDPSRHPAKEVSWYGAACFCDWRSLREGLAPFYNGNWATDASHDPYAAQGYRLPTEAEWEYAARYNDGRLYPWGATAPEGCGWANLNCVGWTKPVGLYPLGVNALGINDLIGNVLEWTNDRWAASYTAESQNPIGPATGTRRSCRGSDCGDDGILYATSTSRQHYSNPESYPWIGFRAVKSVPVATPAFPEMLLVPSGSFQMGQAGVTEPVREVTLTHNFQMASTEITNQQYLFAAQWALDNGHAIVANNQLIAHGMILLDMASSFCEISFHDGFLSLRQAPGAGQWGFGTSYDPTLHPVKAVTWYGAACYCDWLSLMNGITPYYEGAWSQVPSFRNPYASTAYRLPTEAEWEYAAQFGNERTYPWGEEAPGCGLANYSPSAEATCLGWTHPVGSLYAGASSLGLMDLGGNVWEWCNDWWGTPTTGAVQNPSGAATGSTRVGRGGGMLDSATYLKCAARSHDDPAGAFPGMGFRAVRCEEEPPPPVQAYPGELILVPAGTFTMGPSTGFFSEDPAHQVTLTQAFYLGLTEVTESQYRVAALWAIEQGLVQFDGSSLYAHGQYLGSLPGESTYPMINLTWFGAACYCDWVTLMEGGTAYYNGNWYPSNAHNPYDHHGYRLPTEAEWDSAVRYPYDGWTYPWGNTSPVPCVHANFNQCAGSTSPVGSYPAGNSALGFQDMACNVWEYVNDWYESYPSSPTVNPYGPTGGFYCVLRGGSWWDDFLQNGTRWQWEATRTQNNIGFRLCRTP